MREVEVGRLLRERNWTLAVAESCTGGLLAMRVTEIPGASEYFRGGVVAYSNAVKEEVLGVPREVLLQHGAVSRECAQAMAGAVRRLLGADLALAVTGIAGPGGGTEAKPVGLVYLALATPTGIEVRELFLVGSRQGNRWSASEAALELLLDYLEAR